jgi:hypothetical protein
VALAVTFPNTLPVKTIGNPDIMFDIVATITVLLPEKLLVAVVVYDISGPC